MAYVRLSENNEIAEISPVPDTEDIFNYYVAGIAEQFIKVDAPEGMTFGWSYKDGVVSPPPQPPEPQSVLPEETPPEGEQPTT